MAITKDQATKFENSFSKLVKNIELSLFGKQEVIKLVLAALVAEGHVLLEDFPGTGKTALARAISESIKGVNKRIQFTPDLLPGDVTGMNVFDQKSGTFKFNHGPIFANIVLADEINRAGPKTQAALLQAMEEGKVDVDGETRALSEVFMVLATQNPIEQAGTYPLPEAQLDRFMIKTSVGYTDAESTKQILAGLREVPQALEPILRTQEILEMQAIARGVTISDSLLGYVVDIVEKTRSKDKACQADKILMGSSVRGARNLVKIAKAWAIANGRDYVVANDIKFLAIPVLAHRIVLDPEAVFDSEGLTAQDVMTSVLASITPPKDPSN